MANQVEGIASLMSAWGEVSTKAGAGHNQLSSDQIRGALAALRQNAFIPALLEWHTEKYRLSLTQDVIPTFWSNLPKEEIASSKGSIGIHKLGYAVNQLYTETRKWVSNPVLNICFCDTDAQELVKFKTSFSEILKARISCDVPLHFNDYLYNTYYHCFRISRALKMRKRLDGDSAVSELDETEEESFNEGGCPVCGKCVVSDADGMLDETEAIEDVSLNESRDCNCQETITIFDNLNYQLKEMNILDEMSNDAVTSVVQAHIEKHVKFKCDMNFDTSYLTKLEEWIHSTVIGWLKLIYVEADNQFLKESEHRLMHLMYESLAQLRTDQLFDIIVDYPESVSAIQDLKRCLEKCHGFRGKVIYTLKKSFESRLLHPGVATNDILSAYIQTIKALRILDSAGVILQLVCDPIKTYLKSKEDTVRCIITSLTDENSDLIPEFVRSAPQAEDAYNLSDDENIVKNWSSWKPDPIDAAQAPKNSKSMRCSDIVSILVNIYESKDMFVEEYQRLLAQRFLSIFDCNVDFERRNLELLTLKFGESDLNSCEVMLQDLSVSKRIDGRINAGEIVDHHPNEFVTNCLILSGQFWPEHLGIQNHDEGVGLKLPKIALDAIEKYTKAFETIKGSRTLEWKPQIGLVDVELEFDEGQTKTFSVNPIQASIIWQFQEKDKWKISELSVVLGIPGSVVRRKIVYWQNKGILKEINTDVYILIEDHCDHKATANDHQNMDLENDDQDYYATKSPSASNHPVSQGTSGEKFKMYWAFVENMLTNLNSLPLERIHLMLQTFALQGANANELTLQELRHFLDGKIREQKLVYAGGQYRLPPNP